MITFITLVKTFNSQVNRTKLSHNFDFKMTQKSHVTNIKIGKNSAFNQFIIKQLSMSGAYVSFFYAYLNQMRILLKI